MNQDLQLKLQAYLDGELPSGEAKAVADLVAQDADVRALLAELTNTRSALAGFEAEIKLPETREFYWSKIARDIQRQESTVPGRSSSSIFTFLRRLLVPSGVMVALLMGMLVILQHLDFGRQFGVVENETAQVDAGTFTYRDFASGTTLVWLSYPAENEFAESGSADRISWE
jgi:anti-sigma factor RsiW